MNKGKGLIIASVVFLLVGGILACVFRQYDIVGESVREVSYVSLPGAREPENTQPSSEPVTAPSPAAETASQTVEEITYYRFQVHAGITFLHLREAPGLDKKIIGRLEPETTGYVLERGEEWSLIVTGEQTGYVSNAYIDMVEIAKEDYPEEYLK